MSDKEKSRPRERERDVSPSTISQSSAMSVNMEWDPYADVGCKATHVPTQEFFENNNNVPSSSLGIRSKSTGNLKTTKSGRTKGNSNKATSKHLSSSDNSNQPHSLSDSPTATVKRGDSPKSTSASDDLTFEAPPNNSARSLKTQHFSTSTPKFTVSEEQLLSKINRSRSLTTEHFLGLGEKDLDLRSWMDAGMTKSEKVYRLRKLHQEILNLQAEEKEIQKGKQVVNTEVQTKVNSNSRSYKTRKADAVLKALDENANSHSATSENQVQTDASREDFDKAEYKRMLTEIYKVLSKVYGVLGGDRKELKGANAKKKHVSRSRRVSPPVKHSQRRKMTQADQKLILVSETLQECSKLLKPDYISSQSNESPSSSSLDYSNSSSQKSFINKKQKIRLVQQAIVKCSALLKQTCDDSVTEAAEDCLIPNITEKCPQPQRKSAASPVSYFFDVRTNSVVKSSLKHKPSHKDNVDVAEDLEKRNEDLHTSESREGLTEFSESINTSIEYSKNEQSDEYTSPPNEHTNRKTSDDDPSSSVNSDEDVENVEPHILADVMRSKCPAVFQRIRMREEQIQHIKTERKLREQRKSQVIRRLLENPTDSCESLHDSQPQKLRVLTSKEIHERTRRLCRRLPEVQEKKRLKELAMQKVCHKIISNLYSEKLRTVVKNKKTVDHNLSADIMPPRRL